MTSTALDKDPMPLNYSVSLPTSLPGPWSSAWLQSGSGTDNYTKFSQKLENKLET